MVSAELLAALEARRQRRSPEARFWAKVRKGDGCWEWTAHVHKNGYGAFTAYGKTWRAPRFAWYVTHGAIPAGMAVLHSCDNRKCVRPDHLRLGTLKDNTADMIARGRHGFAGTARTELKKAREEIGRLHMQIEQLKKELEIERARVRWLRAAPKDKRAAG